VTDTIARATAAGLGWPLPPLDDDALERRLYPSVLHHNVVRKLSPPDWPSLHRELVTRKDLTLMLLWQEYKASEPNGYQYSYFCDLYRQWHGKLDIAMRQEHRAGEKMFVDYCGRTVPIIDAATGEVREAQVFVAVLGASNYTYAEATWSQSLPDWIGSHVRTFAFLGGVSRAVVPDNLRSAVNKACRYEPDLNPTYAELAAHYGTAVVPARVRKPKDKAKAEVGVQIVQRFVLAALRNRTFFCLAEANAAIRERLELLNNRPFKKLPGCRASARRAGRRRRSAGTRTCHRRARASPRPVAPAALPHHSPPPTSAADRPRPRVPGIAGRRCRSHTTRAAGRGSGSS